MILGSLPMWLDEDSSIIAGERWTELSLLYCFVKNIRGGLSPIILKFDEYMKHRGEILLKILVPGGPEGPKSPDDFLNRILSFHAKNIELINEVFDGDSAFIDALDKACNFVINHNPNPKTHCPSIDLVCYLFVLLF